MGRFFLENDEGDNYFRIMIIAALSVHALTSTKRVLIFVKFVQVHVEWFRMFQDVNKTMAK